MCADAAVVVSAAGQEAERTPDVVQAVRAREVDVAADCTVLGVAGLHPEDILRDPCLSGDDEAVHGAADAAERGSVDADHAKGKIHHGRDEGG